MQQVILILFVLVSAAMIGLILIQQGKGADMGASFGSGSSQTVFGASGGGNVLSRATSVLAVLFFAGSFALAVIARNNAEQAVEDGIPVPSLQESTDISATVDEVDRMIEEIPVMQEESAGTEAGLSQAGDEIPVAPVDQ